MERSEYDKLSALEEEMWWFHGLHANLLGALGRTRQGAPHGLVLDAGCGTGGLLARLAGILVGDCPIGLDADAAACRAARSKSAAPVCTGSADRLPFADGSIAAIIGADLLSHRQVDDRLAVRDFHRCLAARGVLVVNVPAYRWLFSAHDRAVHNARRYSRRRLVALLSGAGFAGIRASYWNTVLFPLMVLRRVAAGPRAGSDLGAFPPAVERLFGAIMRGESSWLARGRTLPFGGSILASAVKP